MKTLSKISLLFSIFFMFTSCKKSDELFKGDVTCKIDGRDWTSYENDLKLSDVTCKISNNGEQFSFTAINTKTSEEISILISTPGTTIVEGTYELNSDSFLFGSYYDAQSRKYIPGNWYKGSIEIKSIDKTISRISGSFHFAGFEKTSNKSVNITEGKFETDYTLH